MERYRDAGFLVFLRVFAVYLFRSANPTKKRKTPRILRTRVIMGSIIAFDISLPMRFSGRKSTELGSNVAVLTERKEKGNRE